MKRVVFSLALLATTMACGLFSGSTAGTLEEEAPRPQSSSPQPAVSPTQDRNPFEAPMTNTPDPDALAETVEITGTISAVLDGEPMTWQTGRVTVDGESGSLAQWEPFALGAGDDVFFIRLIGLPPHESLELDGGALGTRLEIEFIIRDPSAGREISYEITAGEPATLERADVFYFTEGEAGMDMYELVDGQAQLLIESATPGEPAAFRGSFSGALAFSDPQAGAEEPDFSRTIQLAEGQFEVSSVAFRGTTDNSDLP